MRRISRLLANSVLPAALCIAAIAPAWAQSRGTGRAHPPATHTPPRVATPTNPNFAPITKAPGAAPGLGFSYDHLAAVSRPSQNQRRNGRRSQFVTPIFDGGVPLFFPLDYGQDAVDTYLEPQPSVIVVQQPPPPALPADSADDRSPAEKSGTAAVPEPPVPDIGQFILVRRDGKVLMAAAFTVMNDQITYVTREGTRHSFPVSELDTESTRQMNDANGTTVKLPK